MIVQTKRLGIGAWKNKKHFFSDYTQREILDYILYIIENEYYYVIDIRICYARNKYLTIAEYLNLCKQYKVCSNDDPTYKKLFKYCYGK